MNFSKKKTCKGCWLELQRNCGVVVESNTMGADIPTEPCYKPKSHHEFKSFNQAVQDADLAIYRMDTSMKTYNVVSNSGGKDSGATLMVAQDRGVENLSSVFADTGHEHPATYEYLDYLSDKLGIEIQRIKADFTQRILNKRDVVNTKWRKDGVSESIIEAALSVLHPTGVPFLDLCLWKGRFPSTRVRFCTQELKVFPIQDQVFEPLLNAVDTQDIISWQGVRADESLARANLPESDEADNGVINYRPILNWSATEVFAYHKYRGVKWNPLYEKGMGRVGCFPCINCNKQELREIALRYPEELERVKEWERLVGLAAKRGRSTFFPAKKIPNSDEGGFYINGRRMV